MTSHQKRVERTEEGLFRYLRKHGGCNTTLRVLARWHLRNGGRAPGEAKYCYNCAGMTDLCAPTVCANWRPRKKAGK